MMQFQQHNEDDSHLQLLLNRSLAVFQVPQSELEIFSARLPICQRLRQLIPHIDFREPFIIGQSAWEVFQRRLDQLAPEEPTILFCSLAGSQFLSISQKLLYHVFYPLYYTHKSFIFLTSLPSEWFKPRALHLHTEPETPSFIDELSREHIGEILHDRAICVLEPTQLSLEAFTSKIPMTPIEEKMEEALTENGIPYRAQAAVGKYRVDFLIPLPPSAHHLVVECDGRAYHTPERDQQRDDALRQYGIVEILHFTGSQICRDADACIQQVVLVLQAAPRSVRQCEFDALDESQRNAIEQPIRPIRVLAPAGAGKTRTVVNRVIKLLNDGVPAKSILLLAFNRKAREQMIQKLTQKNLPVEERPGDDGVAVHTFNSFGYWYLREALRGWEFESDKRFWADFLRNVINETGHPIIPQRYQDPLADYFRAIERVRRDLEPPDSALVELTDLRGDPIPPFTLQPVLEAYHRRQIEVERFDFDDQIYLTLKHLLANPPWRQKLQRRFEHILVDEFQDLNAAQLALVDILSRPQWSLYAVGDDDQMIYGWRGAQVSNILDFPERHAMSKTVTLNINYRCSQEVIRRASWVISHNTHRHPKTVTPRPNAKQGYFQIKFGEGPHAEAKEIAVFLKRVKENLGCAWRELAVLCRYKDQQPIVAFALDQHGIPRTHLLTYKLFTSTPGNVLRGYLGTVLNPEQSNGEDLRYILKHPNLYLKNELIDWIVKGSPPWSRIEDLLQQPNQEITNSAPGNLEKFRSKILNLHGLASEASAECLVNQIVANFGLQEHFIELKESRSRALDQATDEHLLDILLDISHEYLTSGEFHAFLCEQAEKEQMGTEMGSDELAREEDVSNDRVIISTIHAAKGREYQGVVLFNFVSTHPISDEQVEEERRVFYVGMTRAIHSLLVTTDKKKLHPFLKEASFPPEKLSAPSHYFEQELNQWLQKKQGIEGRIASINEKISNTQSDIEGITSGEYERRLNRKLDEIAPERERIRQLRTEWERKEPASWLKRLFKGGVSQQMIEEKCRQLREESQELERQYQEVEKALSSQNQRKSSLEQERQEYSERQRNLMVDLDLIQSEIEMLETIVG